MSVNYGFIKPENRIYYERILGLKDSTGRALLTPAHIKIVDLVGSYGRDKGCFASLHFMNEQTIRAKSRKTLPRHLEYLARIGVLVRTIEGQNRVYRLGIPPDGPLLSQREFRTAKGMAEYAYARQENNTVTVDMDKEDDELKNWLFGNASEEPAPAPAQQNCNQNNTLFFEPVADNFAQTSGNFCPNEDNFAHVLCSTREVKTQKELQPKPFLVHDGKVPDIAEQTSCGGDGLASRAMGCRNGGPPSDDSSRREQPDIFSRMEENPAESSDYAEPLLKQQRKRGVRQPKNQQERQTIAQNKIQNGHTAHPLGGPNNKPRRCNPKLARDISPDRSVTVPQLFRHLAGLYEKAFGIGVLENMVPTDRTAITAMFGELTQRFIDNCEGYNPSYKDLAEYFDWYFEPKRLEGAMKTSKYSESPGVVHFRQVLGAYYVRKFYETIIQVRQRTAPDIVTKDRLEINEAKDFWHNAFTEFREVYESDYKMCVAMVKYGFAAFAEFLHEEYKLNAEECRRRIVAIGAGLIRTSKVPANGAKYFKIAVETTESKSRFLDEKCVWYDWKPRIEGIVEAAIAESGIKV
jgi:hypothetical protein